MCSCVTNIEFMQQRTFVAQDESNRLSGFDIDGNRPASTLC